MLRHSCSSGLGALFAVACTISLLLAASSGLAFASLGQRHHMWQRHCPPEPGTMFFMPLDMSSDVTATGPTASCLLLPKMAYTRQGTRAPYRPNSTGRPASEAYDMP